MKTIHFKKFFFLVLVFCVRSLSAGLLDDLQEKNLEIRDFDPNNKYNLSRVIKIYNENQEMLGGDQQDILKKIMYLKHLVFLR